MDTMDDEIIRSEALNQVPELFEIPEAMAAEIAQRVMQRERMFWLKANKLEKNAATETLLRRAAYAEIRLQWTEERLGSLTISFTGLARENAALKGEELPELTDRDETLIDSPENDGIILPD